MVQLLPATDESRLKALTTDELKAELRQGIEVTARNLSHLGLVWREIESRGEDMAALRTGMPAYLPLIANGAVHAEAVVRLIGIPHLMKAISIIPLPEQAKVFADGAVAMSVFKDRGWTHQMIPLGEVTESRAKLIFDRKGRRIRSVDEQRRILETPPTELPKKQRKRIGHRRVVADAVTGTVRIGRATAPSIDVIAAMKEAGMIR